MIAFVGCVGKSKSFIRGRLPNIGHPLILWGRCLQGGKLLLKREKGKGKMEKGKERLIFYSQREIKHNSDTNGGVSFLIRLREDVSCLTGGCQSRPRCWDHACEQQCQSGPEKDWGALWVEDPAKLSQRHHLSVTFPFRCNRWSKYTWCTGKKRISVFSSNKRKGRSFQLIRRALSKSQSKLLTSSSFFPKRANQRVRVKL